MKLSRIILKVEQLDKAVQEYRAKGFAVEYGRKKNPINALIYFSNGPYIELLDGTRMPGAAKTAMRFFGKDVIIDRVQRLDDCAPGYCELALENYGTKLNREIAILQRHGIKSCKAPSRRVDTHGRDLRFRLAFPDGLDVPFPMTCFSVGPKPVNFVHPNGIREVGKVVYGTNPSRFAVIRELYDDKRLELTEESGIRVEFIKSDKESV